MKDKTAPKTAKSKTKYKQKWRNCKADLEEMDRYLHYIGGGAGALALTGVAAASAIYLASRPTSHKPLVELDQQSSILPGPEGIHVSKFYKEAKEGKFLRYFSEDARTLYETFRKGAKESNNGPCLGWRETPTSPYQWMRYNETLLRAKNFGSGLVSLGMRPNSGTIIGIYAQNCPEWILTEQGAYCYNLVLVPLYDTLGPEACAFIINEADMSVIVCEDDNKCNLLLDKAPKCLKKLIMIKDTRPATTQRAKNRGVEIVKFSKVEELGAHSDHVETPPKPSDLCTVCYTSGTTGNPKGVMLTHENLVASVCAVTMQLGDYAQTNKDVMMSFLPLPHMLERCCENAMYMVGACVGFFSGDIRRLSDDMRALRPTLIPVVPRVLNRIYDKVQSEISRSTVKKFLFNMAMSAKESEIKRGIIRNNSIWDKLVFRKVQEGMGGRLKMMLVGSAPLAGNVLTFTRCALGCLVLEGYGQTECCAPISLTVQGEYVPEHVGPPVPCNAVKLVDVPEMGYYANKNHGEICVRGSNVFKGYYKDPEKTAEVIDKHGWLHTGDIGMWLANGTLKIVDRKKHIFKLSQGEYIVPEKIETIYAKSQYVQQVFVHGESLKSCIVGIVVPEVDIIKAWAAENNIPGTLSVLCNNPEVKKLILDDMLSCGKDGGLKSFEQVKDIYLHPDPFSVLNGLLTPTMKTKRPQVRSYFTPQLEDMYKNLM